MNRERQVELAPAPPALDGLAEALTAFVLCLLGAAAVGLLLALYMRRRDLAWTWSLFALAPPAALLAALLDGAVALSGASSKVLAATLGLAAGAVGWSAWRRREDRRSGGDIEIAASRRPGVADVLRHLYRERVGGTPALPAEELAVGLTEHKEPIGLPRGSASSGCHVLIPGATGAGKTTSLGALLAEYVAGAGFGAVVLEAKSDAALLEAARAAAAQRRVPFRLISPSGPAGYDPLARGEVDERSERLVATQEWGTGDADFYRQAASPFLRLVLRALEGLGERATLARVAELCDADTLEKRVAKLDLPDLDEEVEATTSGLRADERRAIAGLRARLANLASSEFARRWLDPEREGVDAVDLRAAIGRREVVYFRLDTDRTGNVGRAVAQMALLDLGAAASAMMGAGVGTFVGVDEFGALEASALERLFTRGRAAGFSVALGTQTLADLSAAGPAVRERIGATVSALLCHRLGSQDDAEWVARLIGTVPTWETTVRTDGWGLPSEEGTRTRGHRFEAHPAELQRLGRGEACVARLDGTREHRAAVVGVVPPWERLRAHWARSERGPSGPEQRQRRSER